MGDENVCSTCKGPELKKTQGALGARGGQRGWKAETEREQGQRLVVGLVGFYSVLEEQ